MFFELILPCVDIKIFVNIEKKTQSGIFGNYTDNTDTFKEYKVADTNEIKLGNAKILTVLSAT